MSVSQKPFGVDQIGRSMTLYTLRNKAGAEVSVLDYGAHIVSVRMPDRNGKIDEVALGFDTLAPYEQPHACMGATIGRYANRIGGARFTLNGQLYTLFQNENGNCLHGGRENFQFKWFKGDVMEDEREDAVLLTYVAHDGEEGFPGKLRMQLTVSLDQENRLSLRYLAQSDKDTVVNLTNHAYFNLGGKNILDHTLKINADFITETDDELIPTGRLVPVSGTPFDLRQGIRVGDGIARGNECHAIGHANGYDVNFCVRGEGLREMAVLSSKESGREMRVLSDQPGVQLYTGQGLHFAGHGGTKYDAYYGLALETQHYADSPNHANFPSTTLRARDVFSSVTVYEFKA